MAYNAIIGKIKTRPHLNADKIQLGTIYGEQVIVGLDVKDNDLYILFPCDGQLSEKFCEVNDLIGYTDKDGNKKGGYFTNTRRVRAQKFRGEKSDGFACSLDYLLKVGVSKKTINNLKEGDQFCELDKIPICNKYVTPSTKKYTGRSNLIRKNNNKFYQHVETEQFKHKINNIKPGSIIYVTFKLHGSSNRFAYLEDEVQYNSWYRKLFGLKPKTKLEYKYLVGTRRVILKNADQVTFYGNEEFRYNPMKDKWQNLRKNEVIYGELVGYTTDGKSIMASASTNGIQDKEFKKKYGPIMNYKYGCPVGICKFYVYRIANLTPEGKLIDLPWLQVKDRAKEIGLECVPDACEYPIIYSGEKKYSNTTNKGELMYLINSLLGKPSVLDSSHIEEGVVLRIEDETGCWFLKEKCFEFKVLEGIVKDNPDNIDIEEIQDEN